MSTEAKKSNATGGGQKSSKEAPRTNMRRGYYGKKKPQRTNNNVFKGCIEDLRNDVYNYSANKQDETYAATTREVANYVGRTFALGGQWSKI
mmetsp:Transcript_38908/g.54795  ORF Transcript_38908/g.54795 Transcript_38908/m.54795 type:complete len:92 (+) Transcript_38908:99-374(+)